MDSASWCTRQLSRRRLSRAAEGSGGELPSAGDCSPLMSDDDSPRRRDVLEDGVATGAGGVEGATGCQDEMAVCAGHQGAELSVEAAHVLIFSDGRGEKRLVISSVLT
jgi:hypothetical protein